jgi:hypothetical protein
MSAPSAPILLQERKFFFFLGETADVTSDLEVQYLRVQALPRLVNIQQFHVLQGKAVLFEININYWPEWGR